jgi:hypothetical protein
MQYVGRLSHSLTTMFAASSWYARALRHHVLSRNRTNKRLQQILAYNMSGLGVHRFSLLDRMQQFGLPELGLQKALQYPAAVAPPGCGQPRADAGESAALPLTASPDFTRPSSRIARCRS